MFTLIFKDSQLGDEGAKNLLLGLRSNRGLTTLQLGANTITDAGAVSISEGLLDNYTLQKLRLNNNKLTDKGLASICDALAGNPHLHELDLTLNTGVTPRLEKRVADLLQRNQKLREISAEEFGAYDSLRLAGFMKTIGFEEQGFFMKALGVYNAIERVKECALTGSGVLGASVEDLVRYGLNINDANTLRKFVCRMFKLRI